MTAGRRTPEAASRGPDAARSEAKQRLRDRAARRLTLAPPAQRHGWDGCICSHILGLDAYRRARQILAYWPLADEVSTRPLIDAAIAAGKAVFLPALGTGRSLQFRRWAPGQELVRTRLGVPEPLRGERPDELPSLVLVPGRAFTRAGHRLGRGMGCYDHRLASLADLGPTVGLAYACQIVDRIPCGPRDRRVDLVVCEDGVLCPDQQHAD